MNRFTTVALLLPLLAGCGAQTDRSPEIAAVRDFIHENWDSTIQYSPRDTTTSAGHKKVGVVNREPRRSPKVIRETFLEAINAAQVRIQIINPYLTLNRKLRRALKRAAARGVDVQVMISEKSDIPITPRIVEYNANKLMRSGVKVFVFQGGFHHTKIMTVDGLLAYAGSANLNSRSLAWDYECNLLVADTCMAQQLEQLFEREKARSCYQLTPERWRQIPRRQRAAGWWFHFLQPFVQRDTVPAGAEEVLTIPSLRVRYDA